MATKNNIIGIGEALLAEIPGQIAPAGLALQVALAAQRLGHNGIAISRIGQDATADTLIQNLASAQLNINHLQSDPDLPTGRLIVRSLAGITRRTLQPRAAFDNLQWDFDLIDVAQRADAVVFGMLAQRGGQTQSVITRFLSQCAAALRIFDLTNRDDESFDRSAAHARLEQADVLIIDQFAWDQLATTGSPAELQDVSAALMRPFDIALVLHVKPGDNPQLHTSEESHQAQWPWSNDHSAHAIVGMIHALLAGHDAQRTLDIAGRVLAHTQSNPNDNLPDGWDAP